MMIKRPRSSLFGKATLAFVLSALLLLYAKTRFGIDRSVSIPYPLAEIAPRLPTSPRSFDPSEGEFPVVIQGVTLKTIKRFHKPEGHPEPSVGVLRYRDDQSCTTYASRYEPYQDANLGISYLESYPTYTDDNHEQLDWSTRRAREDKLDEELIHSNRDADERRVVDWGEEISKRRHNDGMRADKAFVIRVAENYTWGRDDISNVRALVAELALRPSAEHSRDVFLMVEVWSHNVSFTMSNKQRQRILTSSVPREFWSITHLTSKQERVALYPDLVWEAGKRLTHSAVDLYRSCFMSLQIFSRRHRQYEYIWSWDLDVRSTADYNNVITDIESYARKDSLDDRKLDRQQDWHVGETKQGRGTADDQEADLITLTPIMSDVTNSGWYWASDFQNMPIGTLKRASVGRNVRLSRRLLDAMNEANVDGKMSAHCESFPATVLVAKQLEQDDQHRWKGVYVPHPIYTEHDWPSDVLAKRLNRVDGYTGALRRDRRDLSFNYASSFASRMYDKWRADGAVCWAPMLVYDILRRL